MKKKKKICERCGGPLGKHHHLIALDVWPHADVGSLGIPGCVCLACAIVIADALIELARSLGLNGYRDNGFGLVQVTRGKGQQPSCSTRAKRRVS